MEKILQICFWKTTVSRLSLNALNRCLCLHNDRAKALLFTVQFVKGAKRGNRANFWYCNGLKYHKAKVYIWYIWLQCNMCAMFLHFLLTKLLYCIFCCRSCQQVKSVLISELGQCYCAPSFPLTQLLSSYPSALSYSGRCQYKGYYERILRDNFSCLLGKLSTMKKVFNDFF